METKNSNCCIEKCSNQSFGMNIFKPNIWVNIFRPKYGVKISKPKYWSGNIQTNVLTGKYSDQNVAWKYSDQNFGMKIFIPVSCAYIGLNIQVVPHARRSLGVCVITDSCTSNIHS